ncbi:MAG TPA: hypothetical protein VM597_36185 [Gemmataceae bacterium]|jgi:hypothetical protein|nr:hypothetical protein [Gemmataceae bacterium]
MATKALATKKAMTPRPAPTGAELRELIRATVAEYFPLCEDVSLLLIPGPGVSPLEMVVAGDATGKAWVSDELCSRWAGRWDPESDG